MPGTSHDLERSLLNELPVKTFDVVREIINFYPLCKVVSIMRDGAPDTLKERFPRITDYEWSRITKKTCLTRLTAIRVTHDYPSEVINFLLNVAMECLECSTHSKSALFSHVNPNHRFLTVWLARCFKVIEAKTTTV